jgi:endoglucanase
VLLDIHNYAKYFGKPLAGNTDLQNGFVDLWLRIATEFKNTEPTMIFGFMNEPNYIPIADWAVLAKRTLAALRKANNKNTIMIAGGRWSGIHDWFSLQDGISNATSFADLKDPLNRTIIEVHQYSDQDYSGTTSICRPPEKFDPMFQKITAWAKTNNQQLFLGEFGAPQTPECLATLEKFLSLMTDPVWRGWTYWAAGRWWNNYPMAVSLTNVSITPQWAVLKKYFPQQVETKSAPKPPEVRR